MDNWKTAAQGEVYLKRLNSLPVPRGWTELKAECGRVVIGHSETGHHHVVPDGDVMVYEKPTESEGMRILRMIVKNTTKLEHLRDFDTHAPIPLDPGHYEVRIGRELDPYENLARRQAD